MADPTLSKAHIDVEFTSPRRNELREQFRTSSVNTPDECTVIFNKGSFALTRDVAFQVGDSRTMRDRWTAAPLLENSIIDEPRKIVASNIKAAIWRISDDLASEVAADELKQEAYSNGRYVNVSFEPVPYPGEEVAHGAPLAAHS